MSVEYMEILLAFTSQLSAIGHMFVPLCQKKAAKYSHRLMYMAVPNLTKPDI